MKKIKLGTKVKIHSNKRLWNIYNDGKCPYYAKKNNIYNRVSEVYQNKETCIVTKIYLTEDKWTYDLKTKDGKELVGFYEWELKKVFFHTWRFRKMRFGKVFTMENEQYPIYNFYIGKKNYHGVTIENILNYNDTELEIKHNYIQWLFPTDEKSHFNIFAPVLTKQEQELMINSSIVQDNIEKAFWKMMHFYGYEENNGELRRTNDYEERIKNWITIMNHNYLRITRILKSLILLNRNDLANMFFRQLTDEYENYKDIIGTETFSFWQDTMTNL